MTNFKRRLLRWRGAGAESGGRDAPRLFRGGLGLALQLSGLTTLQILISFIIQWLVIVKVGVSGQTDALYAGSTLPQIIALLTLTPLASVLVPFLAPKPEPELSHATWDLLVWVLIFFSVATLLLFLAVPVLMPLFVPGFKGAERLLVIRLASVQVLGIAGTALTVFLTCIYQARNKFVWPVLSTLVCALIGLGFLLWKLSTEGVALANYIQVFVNVAPGVLMLRILGAPLRPRMKLDVLRQVGRQMRPLVLGAALFRWGPLLDRWLASFLAPGSLVLLDLAQRTFNAASRILNQGVVTPAVPQLSRLACEDDWVAFCSLRRRKLVEMTVLTVSLTIPIFLAWAFRSQLLALLPLHFAHIPPAKLQKMITVFFLMSGMLLCPNQCLNASYYAQGNTVTPTKVWSVSFVIASATKVVGFFVAGLSGIAVAISFYNLLSCFLLWRYWKPGLAGVVAEERLAAVRKANVVTRDVAVNSNDIPA